MADENKTEQEIDPNLVGITISMTGGSLADYDIALIVHRKHSSEEEECAGAEVMCEGGADTAVKLIILALGGLAKDNPLLLDLPTKH